MSLQTIRGDDTAIGWIVLYIIEIMSIREKLPVVSLMLVSVPVFLGCSASQEESVTLNQAVVDYDLLLNLPTEPISYTERVRPILEQRCVVCHGCFDAPCQLKLGSHAGITRGANKEKVYNGGRIKAAEPTRLFIDARSTSEWRTKGFSPVLNEAENDPELNLHNSVMYKMLRLKQLNPQPRVGMLPDSFTLELDREQTCPQTETFEDYSSEHPLWGMPYAMPNLNGTEYDVLVQWLAQGAPPSDLLSPSAEAVPQIERWESFLNGSSLKEQLMSRYLYEHLALAHIHLADTPSREFYRLVRSVTPPGQPVDEIATRRPFNDPGAAKFYYRLIIYQPSIVAKDHLLYEFSPARIDRYRALFLEPDYQVTEMPPYDLKIATNPFKTFRAMPPNARYRFMLDDARFFINGFIKGPVCRGQTALNVIDDQYWVVFFDPDKDIFTENAEFLDQVADDLQLPAEWGDNKLNLFKAWTEYWGKQKRYLAAKEEHIVHMHAVDIEDALSYIWDGDGTNPNAALTVFRHYDSASVEYGFIGDYPETAWIIDYPLFERIHYLLVAGFDVYGNVGHQLNTRLYMDFLRMEGEDYFLSFLPVKERNEIRRTWYEGVREKRKKMLEEPRTWFTTETVIGYKTDDPQLEFYQYIEGRLGTMAGPEDYLNRCVTAFCSNPEDPETVRKVDHAMERLTRLRGQALRPIPDLAFVRVKTGDESIGDLAYTMVLNKGYSNLTSMFEDEDRRDIDDDTLTVVPGLIGTYPNFFFIVSADDIDKFADDFIAIRGRNDYERFVAVYGMRRTNPRFWSEADWFHASYARAKPLEAGLFDLNRYRNR